MIFTETEEASSGARPSMVILGHIGVYAADVRELGQTIEVTIALAEERE